MFLKGLRQDYTDLYGAKTSNGQKTVVTKYCVAFGLSSSGFFAAAA